MSVNASAVIPYFKRQELIKRAVQSLIVIDLISEVIVVDDEGTDHSAEVLDKLTACYPKVQVVKNSSTSGALSARVEGAISANNELLLFLDSDDECIANGAVQCLSYLANHPNVALCYGNIISGSSSERSDFLRLCGYHFDLILKNLSLCPFSGLCVRKSLIPWGELLRDLPAWQDDEFVLCASKNHPIMYLDCSTAIMHEGGSYRISNNKQRQLNGLVRLLGKWQDIIIKKHGLTRLILWRLRVTCLSIEVWISKLRELERSTQYRPFIIVIKVSILYLSLSRRSLRRILSYTFDRIYA